MSEILLTIAIICVIGLAISIIILFAADKKLPKKRGKIRFFGRKNKKIGERKMKEFYEKRLKQTELKHTMFIRELSRELEDIADKYELLVRSGEQFGEKGEKITDKLTQLAEITKEQYQDYIYHSQYFIKRATAEAEGFNFCVGDSVTLDNGKAIYEISDARKDGGKILYILSRDGETIEAEEQRIRSHIPF